MVDRGACGVLLEHARGHEHLRARHKNYWDLACWKKRLTKLKQRCVKRLNDHSKHRLLDTNHLIRARGSGDKQRIASAAFWRALSNITVRNPGYVLTELLLGEQERIYKQHIQMPKRGSSQQVPLITPTYSREFFESFAREGR